MTKFLLLKPDKPEPKRIFFKQIVLTQIDAESIMILKANEIVSNESKLIYMYYRTDLH